MTEPEGSIDRRVGADIRAFLAARVRDVDSDAAAERAWRGTRPRIRRIGFGPPLAAALGLLCLVVIANGRLIVGPANSPSADASSPTVAPTSTQSQGSTPTIAFSERELSDRFWSRVITYGPAAFGFHTLDEIVDGSELIVRGRIVGRETIGVDDAVIDGDESGRKGYVVIAIDATLKADPLQTTNTVLVRVLSIESFPEAELPRGEVIFFLKNYGRFYVSEGYPTPSDSPRWSTYFLANTYQGALRNLDGKVDVLEAPEGWWDDYGPFPNDLNGADFESVVDQIEALVGG